jgi:hypothetical protein
MGHYVWGTGSTPNFVKSCVFADDTLRNWTVTFIFPRFKYLSAIFRVLFDRDSDNMPGTVYGTLCKTIRLCQILNKKIHSCSIYSSLEFSTFRIAAIAQKINPPFDPLAKTNKDNSHIIHFWVLI